MLQALRDLLRAAEDGKVQDVTVLLLNGADTEASDYFVSHRLSIDTAYITCGKLLLIYTLVAAHVMCPCVMPHEVKHCSEYCCFNHIGNGVLLVAKANVILWRPALVCLLQGNTAMHLAAYRGHIAVIETLLLNEADSEAKNVEVSYIMCICLSQ